MKVVIADDHALFRDGLSSLLGARGVEVVGQAGTGAEALEQVGRLRPDVVLMDLDMPEMDGLEATRRIKAQLPDVKVVMLTVSTEDDDLFEAIKAGAEGYLVKDLDSEKFLDLLTGVGRGEPALTPLLAKKLLSEFAKPEPRRTGDRDPDALTDREMEVLHAMVEGITSNRALAGRLGVSQNTVKFHVRNILDKLHLNNRAQAVGYALREKVIDPKELESGRGARPGP
jgi:DNA-binding NarL/FixJ family response regulator